MRITFDVGRATVQEYNVHYTRKFLKTAYISVRFKEFVDKVVQ